MVLVFKNGFLVMVVYFLDQMYLQIVLVSRSYRKFLRKIRKKEAPFFGINFFSTCCRSWNCWNCSTFTWLWPSYDYPGYSCCMSKLIVNPVSPIIFILFLHFLISSESAIYNTKLPHQLKTLEALFKQFSSNCVCTTCVEMWKVEVELRQKSILIESNVSTNILN